jgi:hypothetical protein
MSLQIKIDYPETFPDEQFEQEANLETLGKISSQKCDEEIELLWQQ